MKWPLAAACAMAVGIALRGPDSVGHAQTRTFEAWLQNFRSAALAASIRDI